MTNKSIKNDQWTVKHLLSKIKNNEIYKPKYQRMRKWNVLPDKNTYNTICSHASKKPHIISCNKYNSRCTSNEDVYREVFIKHLFN